MADKHLLCVLGVGLTFMFVHAPLQILGKIQDKIINSFQQDDPEFKVDEYAITYMIHVVTCVSCLAAPSVISVLGPNLTILIGGVTYALFTMKFLIQWAWLLYFGGAIIACGIAIITTGIGNYLIMNSTQRTVSRNCSIFWTMFKFSEFIANLCVFLEFKQQHTIDSWTRKVVLWTLTFLGIGGVTGMAFLPRPIKHDELRDMPVEVHHGPFKTFKGVIKLFLTKHMLLLTMSFFYTGLQLCFLSSIYNLFLGSTDSDSAEVVDLSGIIISIGEVAGGGVVGILGAKLCGRSPAIITGFLMHLTSSIFIYLNVPNIVLLENTTTEAVVASSRGLALFCSLLLGIGDSLYNTQIYSILGGVYSDNSASAFAIFIFAQTLGVAIARGFAGVLSLYWQLTVLLIFAICGTISFVIVDWRVQKQALIPVTDAVSTSSDDSTY